MAQYTNLNAPPERSLREIIDEKIQTRGSATGAAGVKDLGLSGDVLWTRPDGGAVSVRDVDLDLADARQRLEEAETSLTGTGSRLDAAEQAVQDVRDELANIEVGGGGPLIHDRIPAPSDGEGKPAGTAWLVYGTDGALTSVWQWDGAVWEEMPLDATLIPVLDIGSGTFGDLEGARLVVDDTLSARVVQAMSAEVKELVVTESAILNHATLIGQTVVDDINVQGKLIGTDGVFTGTVDFENINVTGELLARKISGEYIYGATVEGGQFITGGANGESINISSESLNGGPGLAVTGPWTTDYVAQPGIGPQYGGVAVSGGHNASGFQSLLEATPTGVVLRSTGPLNPSPDVPQDLSELNLRRGSIHIRTAGESPSTFRGILLNDDGASIRSASGAATSQIRAGVGEVSIGYSSGGSSRALIVDSRGVWAQSGADTVSLIPQVRKFQYSALWNADQSPAPIMVQHLPGGKLCQAQIRIQNLTGSSLALPFDTWVTVNYNPIPADLRGGYTDYIETTLPQLNARGRVEMNYSTGAIRVKSLEKDSSGNGVTINWTNNGSIWFPMRWFSPN